MSRSNLTSDLSEDEDSDIETTAGEDQLSILKLNITNMDPANNDFQIPRSSWNEPVNSTGTNSQDNEEIESYYESPRNSSITFSSSEDEELEVPADDREGNVTNVVLSQELAREEPQIKELAEGWINSYNTSRFEGLRSMLELILQSTGPLLSLTKQQALDLNKLTFDRFIALMREPNVDPPVLSDVYVKKLVNFLALTLVQDVCLNDVLIMKRIQNLLKVFINSTWVSARYAALMIGSQITIQYIEYWSRLNTQLNGALAAENEAELRKEKEVVENFFDDFIKFVVIGMRDYNPEVRTIAVRIFSSWCHQRQQLLMKDFLLRHVYWALFDGSPTILYFAILTCKSLYASEYVMRNLPLFVQKTLPIIIRRAQDRINYVSKEAVNTVVDVHRAFPEVLQHINVSSIYLLLFGSRKEQAAKAAAFLNNNLQNNVGNNNVQYIFNTIIFILESLAQIGEQVDPDSVVSLLVDKMMPVCHKRMTDWVSWGRLLLENGLEKKEHKELACILLVNVLDHLSMYAGDHFFVNTEFPPVPTLDNCREKKSKAKKRKLLIVYEKNQCVNYLIQMTKCLGPVVVELWDEFANNKTCLIKLAAIPQYFNGNIDTLDIIKICCCLVVFRNKMTDSDSLHAIHRSMACLYHLMLASERWKHDIPNFERVLFNNIPEKFIKLCEELNNQPLPGSVEETFCLKEIKLAYFLTKFFNVTKTCLSEDVINCLNLGKSTSNAKIISPTASMSLYIIQWQLLDIVEGEIGGDEMTARLYKIKSQSQTLVTLLEGLINSKNSFVRDSVYMVMCRLYVMLSPHNPYVKSYPQIHLSPPSLEVMEWLNFSMVSQVPKTDVPEDDNQYELACSALQMFCLLLRNEVLALEYFTSILGCFQFHARNKNYNSILESIFRDLAKRRSVEFPHMIIESLAWMMVNTDNEMVEIIKGICSVGLAKLKPEKLAQKTALEIVIYGLTLIKTDNHHVFLMLAPFVTMLGKRDAREVFKSAAEVFQQDLEKPEMTVFLDAFGRSTNHACGRMLSTEARRQ